MKNGKKHRKGYKNEREKQEIIEIRVK